jgi:hypothetical protein
VKRLLPVCLHVIDGCIDRQESSSELCWAAWKCARQSGGQPLARSVEDNAAHSLGKVEVLTAIGAAISKYEFPSLCRSGAVNQDLEETWRRIRRLKA